MSKLAAFLFAILLASGCSSEAGQGAERQRCYPNGTCNQGLSCLSDVCVNPGRDGAADDRADRSDASDAVAPTDGAPSDAMLDQDVDATPPPPPPSALPGLALWLRADRGVTRDDDDQVTRWEDQSPNGNDAVPAQPGPDGLFIASSLRGRPAVRFSGAASAGFTIASDPSLFFGTSDFLIAVVLTPAGAGTIYRHDVKTPPADGDYLLRLGLEPPNGTASATFMAGKPLSKVGAGVRALLTAPHVVVLRRTTPQPGTPYLQLRVDGSNDVHQAMASFGQSLDIPGAASGYDIRVGQLAGDVAEIVVVIGRAGTERVAELETYLIERYR